jgi:hypothetical protein
MKYLEHWFDAIICCCETFKSRGKSLQCYKERGCGHVQLSIVAGYFFFCGGKAVNSDHVIVQSLNKLSCLCTKCLLISGQEKIFVMMGFLYLA